MIKRLIAPIFIAWEKIFSKLHNIYTVENSPYGLLRMSIHPYSGHPLPLEDGSTLQPGEYVAELHISNTVIYSGKVGNVTVASDIHLLPLFREEMRNLARLARDGRLDPRVRALWGVTLFGPGVRRMGFQMRPLPAGKNAIMLKAWMGFLRWVFSPPTVRKRSKTSAARQAQEFWMSIKQLIEKYGD